MSDILLTENLDLDLSGHRLSLATGAAAIEQQVRIRLRFFLAEWFLDRRLGIPYFRDILIKNPSTTLVESMFRRAVETTPGISAVTSISATIDAPAREMAVNFQATLDTGEVLDFSPFVLEL